MKAHEIKVAVSDDFITANTNGGVGGGRARDQNHTVISDTLRACIFRHDTHTQANASLNRH